MKVFISQPMRGKTDEEILAEREKAIRAVKEFCSYESDEECEIIDSFFQEAPVGVKPLWYMGESIKLLAEADLAYFVKGYEKARGCVIEVMCARLYGIPTFFEDAALTFNRIQD